MRRIVLLLVSALLAAGCAEYRQITIENGALAGFRFNGTSSATIELEADVYNPTPHVIFLDEVDAVLFREGKEFARFALEDKPSAAADTGSKVRIPVRASGSDPISIISAGLNLSSWNLDDLVVDGRIVVKSDAGYKKTFRMKKTPVKDILKMIK